MGNILQRIQGAWKGWKEGFFEDPIRLSRLLSWWRLVHIFGINFCWVLFGLNANASSYIALMGSLLLGLGCLFVWDVVKYTKVESDAAQHITVTDGNNVKTKSYYFIAINFIIFCVSILYSLSYLFYSINYVTFGAFMALLVVGIFLLIKYKNAFFSNDFFNKLNKKVNQKYKGALQNNQQRISWLVLIVIELALLITIILAVIYSNKSILLLQPFIPWVTLPHIICVIATSMLVVLIYGMSERSNHSLHSGIFAFIDVGMCGFILYQLITEVGPNVFLSITPLSVFLGLASSLISVGYGYCGYDYYYNNSELNLAAVICTEQAQVELNLANLRSESDSTNPQDSGGSGLVPSRVP